MEENAMAKTASLNIRIDPETKRSAEKLFGSFGITVTDAVNMFLHQSLMLGGLPFEVRKPGYTMESSLKTTIRSKATIARAREMGRVLHVSEAFKTYPVDEECNNIYGGITKDDIIMVVGSVTPEQLELFWDAYEVFLDSLESGLF